MHMHELLRQHTDNREAAPLKVGLTTHTHMYQTNGLLVLL